MAPRKRSARALTNTQVTATTFFEQVADRLDGTIDKLTTATAQLATTMASHSQRLTGNEQGISDLKQDVQGLRDDQREDIRHVNERIDDVRQQLTDEITAHTNAVKEHFDVTVGELAKKQDATNKSFSTRLKSLERWQWVIIGGSGVVLFIIVSIILRFVTELLKIAKIF